MKKIKVNFNEIYIFQLIKNTPGIMPSISEGQWQALGIPLHALKKTKELPIIPSEYLEIKNKLITKKRNFLSLFSIPGGNDWVILAGDNLKDFIKAYEKLSKEIRGICLAIWNNYDHDREAFEIILIDAIKKAGILPGENKLIEEIAKGFIAQYYPSLEILEDWELSLFYPISLQGYLDQISQYCPASRMQSHLNQILSPALAYLENECLELAGDYLKGIDLAKESAKARAWEKLLILLKYVDIFENDLDKDLISLIRNLIEAESEAGQGINLEKIRKAWARKLSKSPLEKLGERNLAHWICPNISSPKSRSSKWGQIQSKYQQALAQIGN